jgi:hypothetical protein
LTAERFKIESKPFEVNSRTAMLEIFSQWASMNTQPCLDNWDLLHNGLILSEFDTPASLEVMSGDLYIEAVRKPGRENVFVVRL